MGGGNTENKIDRRKVLRTTGAAIGGGLTVGASGIANASSRGRGRGSGEGDERGYGHGSKGGRDRRRGDDKPHGVEQSSFNVASTNGDPMNERERNKFFNRMAAKHDEVIVDGKVAPQIASEGTVGALGQEPSEQPGELIDDGTDYNSCETALGSKIVECDYYYALYKTDVYDGDKQHHFFWVWAAASSYDHLTFTGNIYNFYIHIVPTWWMWSEPDFLTYKPDADLNRHGVPITIGAGVEGAAEPGGVGVGASANISGEFVVSADTVRPHPQKCSAYRNEFCTQWIGDYEGTAALNGTSTFKHGHDDTASFSVECYLDGGKYMKTI